MPSSNDYYVWTRIEKSKHVQKAFIQRLLCIDKFKTNLCDIVCILALGIYSLLMLSSLVIITALLGFVAFVTLHDDVVEWKHFPSYWHFVRGIECSPVDSLPKSQWRGALMFSLICACTNSWGNNWDAGDLRRPRVHYDVIIMVASCTVIIAPVPSN